MEYNLARPYICGSLHNCSLQNILASNTVSGTRNFYTCLCQLHADLWQTAIQTHNVVPNAQNISCYNGISRAAPRER